MIVRFSSKSKNGNGAGKSFRDLSRYLTTGSEGENNPDRALWIEGVNVYASDPAQAWAEMAFLAENQSDLKRAAKQAGLLAKNAPVHHKEETPVWHAMLSWGEGDNPSRERMMEAAKSFMDFHGIGHHQFVVWAHGDGGAPHLHIMASLIDPEKGTSARQHVTRVQGKAQQGLQVRASDWARQWEQAHPEEKATANREAHWQKRQENALAVKAWEAVNAGRKIFGKGPLPFPDLKKAFDHSVPRHVWEMMKGAAATVRQALGNDPAAAPIAAKASADVADVHKSKWREHFGAAAARAGDELTPEALLHEAVFHQSTFDTRDLARLAHKKMPHATAEEFAAFMAKVSASDELVKIATEKGERFTTREQLDIETQMLGRAIIMGNTPSHPVAEFVVNATEQKAAAAGLTAEQQEALKHVTSPLGLSCVVGYAGAGKSMLLQYARQSWEAQGYTTHGAAYSGLAAQSLEEGSGIQSRTLAGLEYALNNGRMKLTKKDVLVIDEAGMVGSRQMARVLTAAQDVGAKVVLVGDYQQLQSIEAGGAFRAIVRDGSIGAAQITGIQRQGSHVRHDAEAWASYEWQRDATKQLAEGDTAAALDAYRARGFVHSYDRRSEAQRAVVDSWFADRIGRPDASAIMIASTRKDVAALNQMAREAMKSAGMLNSRADSIDAVEEVPDEMPKAFKLDIATGERLMFTKNDKRMGVKNGTLGVLEGIDSAGRFLTVRLDGRENSRVVVDLTNYRNLAYGYAATAHKQQGLTADRAHVLATNARNMDRHAAYVAMSRHRDSVTVHYGRDDFRSDAALAKHLSREQFKESTTDLIAVPAVERLQRLAVAGDVKRLAVEGRRAMTEHNKAARALSAGSNPRTSGRGRDTSRTRGR